MTLAPLFISCLALLFTVASFYWLQARKGRLKLYPITTFSGAASSNSFFLRLPIIVYNSGAKPRVVGGIRLRLCGESSSVLECHTFRKSIEPKPDDTEDFAHPYVVGGRNVVTKFAHFHGEPFGGLLSDRSCVFSVEVLIDDGIKWESIGRLNVHTEIMYTGAYITYSNNAGVWPDDILTRAKAHRDSLESLKPAQ